MALTLALSHDGRGDGRGCFLLIKRGGLSVAGGFGGVVFAVAGAFVADLVGGVVDELSAVADFAVLEGLVDAGCVGFADPCCPDGGMSFEEVETDGVFFESDSAASDFGGLFGEELWVDGEVLEECEYVRGSLLDAGMDGDGEGRVDG